ncbi:OB-fold protein [Archangium lansingense]|uniref:OB-fold protein n=1 Tax=Archangium lansingense TaxID=2995310 RepID=UPI003B7C1A51
MALMKCKQCGGDVASNAVACPKCGAPPPRGASIGKKVAIALAGLFGLCFFGTCVSALSKGGSRGSASAARASARSTEAATPVEIRTLLGEYSNNEVRADANYKGRFIQTTGIVRDVKKDIVDSIYVTLGTGQQLEIPVVQCLFDDVHAKKAASLSPGARVTVRGRVSGLLMNVVVRECEFVGL